LSGQGNITQSTNPNPIFDFNGGMAQPMDTIINQLCGSGSEPNHVEYRASDQGRQLTLTLTPAQLAAIIVTCPAPGVLVIQGTAQVTFQVGPVIITDPNALFMYTFIDGDIAGGADRFRMQINSTDNRLDHDSGFVALSSHIKVTTCP
jgi:hypothetical protein